MNRQNKTYRFVRNAVPVVIAGAATSAMATGTDFSTLTSGIDITTLSAAIMAVALIGVGYYLASGGAKAILGMIRHVVK